MAKQQKGERLVMLGTAARLLRVDVWMLQRLFERRLAPQPQRIGRYRVVRRADFPALRRALRTAGYLEAVPA